MSDSLILRELGLAPRWRLKPNFRDRRAPQTGDSAIVRATVEQVPAGPAKEALVPAAPMESPLARPDPGRRRQALAEVAAEVSACTACGLCRARHLTVPGVGDTSAGWMFIGEAPGAEEDARGEPFVGQAGRLLDNMLAAIGLSRTAGVFIANVVKCRPPGNRTPEPSEVEACRPFLDRQIAAIEPQLIVALGKSAATTLLNVDATIASLRGKIHRYQGVPLIVTYHPAYLLRNLPDKAKAWEDLCLARATMRQLKSSADAAI